MISPTTMKQKRIGPTTVPTSSSRVSATPLLGTGEVVVDHPSPPAVVVVTTVVVDTVVVMSMTSPAASAASTTVSTALNNINHRLTTE